MSFGYTNSDGVSGATFIAPDGNAYNRIDPANSFSWGLNFGFNVNANTEIGFMWGQQLSKMTVSGPSASKDVGDLTVNTYHPYFGFNFGEEDAKVRPYVLIGFGATSFGQVNYTKANGTTGNTQSETRYSTTIGAGIKAYPNPKFGIRVGVQWTPTYIKTDSTGMWCDPYWGCYATGSAQYSNQFQFLGGLLYRF